MLKRTNVVQIIGVTGGLAASSALAGSALARGDAPPKPQGKLVSEQSQVRQVATRLGSYKSGEAPREETTSTAGTEEDQGKRDDLDATSSKQSSSQALNFAAYGK